MTIDAFHLRIKSLADNLKVIGGGKDMIIYILSGLNNRYNLFVESITSRCDCVGWEENQSRLT